MPKISPQAVGVTCAATYLLGAVLAFGHAMNHCESERFAAPPYGTGQKNDPATAIKIVVATILWPFYFSAVIQEPAITITNPEKP